MRMPANLKTLALPLFVWLAFFAVDAHAAIDNAGVFDSVLDRYQAAASGWAGVITTAATWLFWTLVVISMVWTFGMMALRKADIGEFFAEFVRFTIFTGFFWWALTNGPNFASSIYASLRQLAGNATGLGNALSPSGIVDVGFAIFDKVMDQSSVWSPVDSMAGILMAVAILVILALVGVNMLLLLASGWVLAYGGVFFLGFGGSRWTSDMAINYYKVVLGVAAQLFAMVLLVGIGKTFLDDYYSRMSAGISLKEMGVMLIVVIILLALVNKIPPLIAGIITGASVGGAGIGQFGAGAALGAAGMAAAAAATGGAALAAGAASAAGGASAVMAAFSRPMRTCRQARTLCRPSRAAAARAAVRAAAATPAPAARPSLRLRALAAAPAVALRRVAAAPRPAAARAARRAAIRAAAKPTRRPGQQLDGQHRQQCRQGRQERTQARRRGRARAAGRTGQHRPRLARIGRIGPRTAGRIAADAGANLAKGTADVAKAKAASLREAAAERIADTTGGKIAAAIKAQGSGTAENIDVPDQQPAPSFGDNSLAGGPADADPESEVAAFANREQGRDGTTA
ncbi:P-type conjugative transfer protein TrbL [Variovorax sp. E3]|uniref:P-type conjugative transfer protein TrbL n=1 Tax=Variovorax sp. E3 TaxID=1914993 RepID=UPI0022B68038|nr:P-type conjugative transfer protein TrbL [Variovorax sp. E3]